MLGKTGPFRRLLDFAWQICEHLNLQVQQPLHEYYLQ